MTSSRTTTVTEYDKLGMREKQLIASLRQGRACIWQILDEDPMEGYLAGWDDDTYLVLIPTLDDYDGHHIVSKILIPKQNLLYIQLRDDRTFREEAAYEEMEKLVGPFRERINRDYPPKRERVAS